MAKKARADAPAPDSEVQDIEQAMRHPAVYANRFRVRVGLDVTRLAFAEAASQGADPHYRISVVLPTSEAVSMANTLRALADKLQKRVTAAATVAAPNEKLN